LYIRIYSNIYVKPYDSPGALSVKASLNDCFFMPVRVAMLHLLPEVGRFKGPGGRGCAGMPYRKDAKKRQGQVLRPCKHSNFNLGLDLIHPPFSIPF
ncbi:MAG: hypothetical protein ACK5VH_10010, partial [bacterium]